MVHHLAPKGVAGFVLANGSMSSNQSGEGEIRKTLIEAELVDCMVALTGPALLLDSDSRLPLVPGAWAPAAAARSSSSTRGKLGRMVDRTHRELTDEDIARIADTYHAWADRRGGGRLRRSSRLLQEHGAAARCSRHGHVLTPGRYVGAEPREDDGEPFEDKMKRLVAELREQAGRRRTARCRDHREPEDVGVRRRGAVSNSDERRWQQRLDNFGTALAQLTNACERERYDDLERAGLIKTFEFCFELSWKVLKDLLFYEGHDVKAPRAVIRKSFEVDYIEENDCETLLDALGKRNLLSHTYRNEVAVEAETLIKERYYPVLLRFYRTLDAKRTP